MAPLIATVVQWVVLPSIMVALFAFAWVIVTTAKYPELKVSAWAGLFAGLVTFVIYVVSQLRQINDPDFRVATLPGLLWVPLGSGLAAGFAFLWLIRFALPTRLVGILTLMLSASSSAALFSYLFLSALRVTVLYWTLGSALGILLHVVLFPESLQHIFGGKSEPVNEPWLPRRGAVATSLPLFNSVEGAAAHDLGSGQDGSPVHS
jgi:hypothetical protein